jgi:hypothetical protein
MGENAREAKPQERYYASTTLWKGSAVNATGRKPLKPHNFLASFSSEKKPGSNQWHEGNDSGKRKTYLLQEKR